MAASLASAAPRWILGGRPRSPPIYTFFPPSIAAHRISLLSPASFSFHSLAVDVRRPVSIPPSDCRFFCGFRSPFLRVRPCKSAGSETGVVEEFEKVESREEKFNGLSNQALRQASADKMTITPNVRISAEGRLVVSGKTVLSGVPDNVTLTSASDATPVDGVFLGAHFLEPASRHVVSLGTLRDVRFMACFRFKLWWMSQSMGYRGRDIPLETQFLLIEIKDEVTGETSYSVFLPLVDGSFRSSLQGGAGDELELVIESGDASIAAASFSYSLFLSAGQPDPFAAISNAVAAARSHLKTFRRRVEKNLPPIVDLFGWCTWDAFYQDVTQEGVEAGLQALAAGGAPPKFVIIDDGWQSVGLDQHTGDGEGDEKPSLMRLTGIKENSKFQNKESPKEGIKSIVDVAKEKYGLSHVYVWHAITGYWGGVRPAASGMEHYGSAMKYPQISPGVVGNEPGWKTDQMTLQGLGLVDPKKVYQFYDELHSYLAGAGVDGVKVDVQSVLETLGAGHGGRVELTKLYHQALDASVRKNFPNNGIIACMSHSSDALYYSKQTAVVRASDDFYPRDPGESMPMHSPPLVKLGRVAAAPAKLISLARRKLTSDSGFLCAIGGCSCYFAASRSLSTSCSPAMALGAARSLQAESPRRILIPNGVPRPDSAAAFPSGMNPTAPGLVVVSFYKFADFPDHLDFKKPLKDLCEALRVSGGIILAPEGINGSICGSRESVEKVLDLIQSDRRLNGLRAVESAVSPEQEAIHHGHSSSSPLGAGEDSPFRWDHVRVKVKQEIVSFGDPSVSPIERVGTYVNPKEWNELIEDPDTIVIDVRNTYETRIGKFKGAVDPRTSAFREFPAWVDDQFELSTCKESAEEEPSQTSPKKLPRVAMYCTGGIRCEKASSFLLSKGFREVYHLKGGILKYLEEMPKPESKWEGECFVFDKRVSVEHGLAQGSFKLCYGCKQPVSEEDMASPLWERGVSCPHCVASKSEEEKERARARQRQFQAWGVIGGPDKGRRSSSPAVAAEKKVHPVPRSN